MKAALLVVFVVAFIVTESSGWWLGRRSNRCGNWWRHRPCTSSKCSSPSRGEPFYFGTTNLWCMKKGKREESPSRPDWALKHRWIQFKGHFFERLTDRDVWNTGSPTDANRCSHNRESSPAGYSSLSVDCLKACTAKYRQRYGSYKLLSNNCHDFANRFADILCSSTTCPSWCN